MIRPSEIVPNGVGVLLMLRNVLRFGEEEEP